MSTPEQRRRRAHALELSAGTPAGVIATTVAAERARDQYKHEQPRRAARKIARIPGPIRATADTGHVGARLVMTSAALGATAYGAQRYQEQSLLRETHRQKAAAQAVRVRERIGPKGADMGVLQELAKSDRAKRNVGNAALLGGGVMAFGARESQQSAKRSVASAETARAGARSATRRAGTGALRAAAAVPTHLADIKGPAPSATGATQVAGSTAGKAGSAFAEGSKFLADHAEVGAHIADARRLHAEVGTHTAAAAKHLHNAHTKAGVAAGLLATAAAAHASRRRPDSVQFY